MMINTNMSYCIMYTKLLTLAFFKRNPASLKTRLKTSLKNPLAQHHIAVNMECLCTTYIPSPLVYMKSTQGSQTNKGTVTTERVRVTNC